jgi:hypothetical protein
MEYEASWLVLQQKFGVLRISIPQQAQSLLVRLEVWFCDFSLDWLASSRSSLLVWRIIAVE